MDGPLACDAYDRGRKARSLVGRAVLYSSRLQPSRWRLHTALSLLVAIPVWPARRR